jgi:Mg2+/Co2+ transporter CorB
MKLKIYRMIIFSVVFYGCETWSLILTDKHRLRVLENRIQRKAFEFKRRKQHENGENSKIKR